MAINEVKLTTTQTITRNTIKVDKIILDIAQERAIIVYSIGDTDDEGELINIEEKRLIYSGKEYWDMLNKVFGSEESIVVHISAVAAEVKAEES